MTERGDGTRMKVNCPWFVGNEARIVRRVTVTSHKDVFRGRNPMDVNRNGLRNRRTPDEAKGFANHAVPFLVCAVLLMARVVVADVGSSMRRGNYLEHKGEYEDALKHYQEALVQEPDNPKIHYNIGRVLYRMERYDESIGEFQLGFLEKEKYFQSDVFYNIGNNQFRKGQLEAAIESYKMSLLVNPDDIEAKQNLEFCMRIKDQMQQEPQSDSTQQQEQQKQQQQRQPREGEISKEEAERVLQAIGSEEKENLEKSRAREKEEHADKDW